MPTTFNNSPSSSTLKDARVETGTVANANGRTMTVDWVSQYSGRQILDIQVMSPYFHFNNGEGFSILPEVGAICAVCFPSDDDSPFVMGFLSGPELLGAESSDNVQDQQDDPEVNGPEDMETPITTSAGGSTETGEGNQSEVTYRGARPILNPGDQMWQGRDENFVILRRGGVLQIGATKIAQRAYIPIDNFIRDFCENYELVTASGSLSWTVERQENDPEGNAPTNLSLVAREFAQDAKASVRLSVGSLDAVDPVPGDSTGKSYIELVIAPQGINPDTGEVEGTQVYALRLDKVGNSFQMQSGTRTDKIGGAWDVTVEKNHSLTVKGDRKTSVGGVDSTTIKGDHVVEGSAGSKETWTGLKSISAAILKLGGDAASEPLLKGLQSVAWLASHSHPGTGPPIQAAALPSILSTTVFTK